MPKKLLVIGIAVAGVVVGALVYETLRGRPSSPSDLARDGEATRAAITEAGKSKGSSEVDLSVDEKGLSKAIASLTTQYGVIKFRFYSEDAPNTVARFVELIQSKFYDGLTFHRVIPQFVAQGGDPDGTGMGGSGQKMKAEFNKRKHLEGTLAMARARDPDSADSQFYFVLAPQPHLDNNYTVFGQVVEGLELIHKIKVGDKMISVTVE